MKEIKAIIQPTVLDKVLMALHAIKGLPGSTVSFVHGHRRADGTEHEHALEYDERAKLEIVVKDADVKRVVETIRKTDQTGSKGDGKIFVIDCADVIRVRTGEKGEAAI
jgi:nitrogen regulatory protein P-II 1